MESAPKSKLGRPKGRKDMYVRKRRGKIQLILDAINGVKQPKCAMQSHVQAPCPLCKSCLSLIFFDPETAPEPVNVLSLDSMNALTS